MVDPNTKDYWRVKNSFYYDYVENLVRFIVPPNKRVLRITDPKIAPAAIKQTFDYIVMTDVLDQVDDVEKLFRDCRALMGRHGRMVITQYSVLWEPLLHLASRVGWRRPAVKQNWLSPLDLNNFLRLAGFEVVKSGTKMLLPKYIPLLHLLANKILANLFPFSRWGLIHYIVARPLVFKNFTSQPSLSIIVPARNEWGTIERIAKELPALGVFTEIIFIEGGSRDQTLEKIKQVVASSPGGKKRLSFAEQTGRGKGDAVRLGFSLARGDILVIYDADMTVPPAEIAKFYRALVENRGDFINGSRLVYPLEKESMRWLNLFGNKFFSLAFSWILSQPLKDTLCGTKALWRKDYEAIKRGRSFFGDFDPFGDFDLLFGAAKLNLKIIDLPIRYGERVYGNTNISRWRHGWLLLKMTVFAARKFKFR